MFIQKKKLENHKKKKNTIHTHIYIYRVEDWTKFENFWAVIEVSIKEEIEKNVTAGCMA